ncbi:MAG: hypothetical protein KJ574_02575 [Nanoarchaeota archaeon]|nr:hypothetical protein [Nanoarchaeota archaeon]
MSIKGINRGFTVRRHEYSGILDRSITVKDILKYAGYGLLFLAVLFIIVLIPFMIGRASVNCDCKATGSENSLNRTAQVTAATALIDQAAANSDDSDTDANHNSTSISEEDTPIEEDTSDEENEDAETQDILNETVEETYDENARYLRTDPRVATTYNDVDIDLLSYEYEIRGMDWGTIDKVKIIMTNNQDKLVLPYTLKLKIYNVGDHPSDWWDDEVNLRDQLNIITPDGYKIVELTTHVSFSNLNDKKRFSLYLFDEVGKEMSSRVKEIEISPED